MSKISAIFSGGLFSPMIAPTRLRLGPETERLRRARWRKKFDQDIRDGVPWRKPALTEVC
jgi:hypothetical protein